METQVQVRTGIFRTLPVSDSEDTIYIPLTVCNQGVIGITLTKRVIIVGENNEEICECSKDSYKLVDKYNIEIQNATVEYRVCPFHTCLYFGEQEPITDEELFNC